MELEEILISDKTNKPNKNEKGFNQQIRIFELLLSRYLKGIKTEQEKFIFVYCLENINETIVDTYTVENGLTVRIPYNPIRFIECKSIEDKFIEFTRIIKEYIFPIFINKNWDFSPVIKALDKIKEHDYHAEFLLKGTPKKSPDKNYTAYAFGIHTVNSFKLISKVFDKNGLMIKEKILVEDFPNETVYRRYLGKPEWIDNDTFQISSKSSKWKGIITIDE